MSKNRPSMRDVAKAADVSVSAVSIVVRGKAGVSEETRKRVWEAISRLGYAASLPEPERPQAVGLLIERSSMPAILDIFYGDVLHGFQVEAQRLGYRVHLHMFDRASEQFDSVCAMLAGEVQGLVIANDGNITAPMVAQLQALELPIVVIESSFAGSQVPCVLGDNIQAGYSVMEHLLQLGHRDIAILRGPRKYSSLVDRLKGCLAAAAEAGITIPSEYLPAPISGHPKKGYMQMQEILALPQRPSAVVAISDKTAFGAIEAIKEAGLRIPDDIALISIDNVAESAYTRPPLSSYHMPRAALGQIAMLKLERLISGEQEPASKSVVYGELVLRESSGSAIGPSIRSILND
jgi:DNA-binding LacI/PurR family transcriptional regulator